MSPQADSRSWTRYWAPAAAALFLLAFVFFGYVTLDRISAIQEGLGQIDARVDQVSEKVEAVDQRSRQAEEDVRQAAAERSLAEAARLEAEQETAEARSEADFARRQADQAQQETEAMRAQREVELNRMHEALNLLAETRRNASGLVMNLDSEHMRFDFDKSDLRPENRELLSRIAGILLASPPNYGIYVFGHTDAVGGHEYNLGLSRRRAETVRDYLVGAGIEANRIETKGFGKTRPLVTGHSERARAKNRRVEIGIIDTKVVYERTVDQR